MEPQTFAFFGIIGSGKGTQIDFLIGFLKEKGGECLHISPGAEYREMVASRNHTGELVKSTLDRGNLLPDFLTDAVFVGALIDFLSDAKHLIADGYPRTVAQSETFDRAMKFYRRDRVKIINIEVGREEAVRRNLLRGRHDDTMEGIERRIEEYERNVIPALEYFRNREGYEILKINGEQSREAVREDIMRTLGF